MEEQKFKPAQPVLVRDDDEKKWSLEIFSHYDEVAIYPYCCLMHSWKQCLPLKGNEHFLNTTDSPEQKWEPKCGEPVFVRDGDDESWTIRLFVTKKDGMYFASRQEDLASVFPWKQCKPCKPNSEDE